MLLVPMCQTSLLANFNYTYTARLDSYQNSTVTLLVPSESCCCEECQCAVTDIRKHNAREQQKRCCKELRPHSIGRIESRLERNARTYWSRCCLRASYDEVAIALRNPLTEVALTVSW